ncbi:multidrug ABC transporter ATPase [Microbacterium sp. VKM Ac-2870]|uniref:multidrug ABC transporter ATPase n=1 Tax=Microbacterium sp. VKM Ac-2870 TaxID=2783825 RepID=UPI00188ABD3A|nr:multidrug ABC transporter ATPase [Microbacterium sp. VKM Ac-2870]MBF4563338.1 multidrug ABC transporter ATPase [Microbacterium sp. VKM Ac-2870]
MPSSRSRTPGSADDLPVRQIDRVLAFMSLGLLLLSVICFVAIMIGSATGMKHDDFGQGAWPLVGTLVYIAPIVAFVLLMVVLVMTFVRKARAGQGR